MMVKVCQPRVGVHSIIFAGVVRSGQFSSGVTISAGFFGESDVLGPEASVKDQSTSCRVAA